MPTEKYYKPHFLQSPPQEISVLDGKFVRLDIKVSVSNLLLRIFLVISRSTLSDHFHSFFFASFPQVTGLPIPAIEFLKDGYPVRRDHLHKIVVRENNIHSLLIEKATANRDSGEYVIRASNKAGVQVVKSRLVVQPKMEMIRPSFVKRMQGPLKLGIGETIWGGGFTSGRKSIIEERLYNMNERKRPLPFITLEIQAKGNPPPQIGWKKGSDGIIPNDDRIVLEFNEQTCSQKLTIHNITKYDQGWYTCSAVNRAGIASCTCKVDILDEWEMEHLKGEEENISHAPKHGSLYSKGEKDDYDSPHLGGLGGINASAFWGSVTGRSSDQTNFRSTFTHPSHSSKNLRGSPTCSQNSELR